MIDRAFRRLTAIAVVLPALLAGCASLAPPSVPSVSAPRPFQQEIELGGRLSVHYQSSNKEEALHGSFTWAQTASDTTVTLLSPLGQTLAIITATPAGATLAQSGQALRSATDVNTLTTDTLGWPLPIAGLRDWLQGFAVDRSGQPFAASPLAPAVETRDGWQIRYQAWAEDGTARARPRRIDLARYTTQAGDVSIRIVIDTWQAH